MKVYPENRLGKWAVGLTLVGYNGGNFCSHRVDGRHSQYNGCQ